MIDHNKSVRDLLAERGQALQGFEQVLDLPVWFLDNTSRYRTVVWQVVDVKRVGQGVQVVRKGTHTRGHRSEHPEEEKDFYPDRDPATTSSRPKWVEIKKPRLLDAVPPR